MLLSTVNTGLDMRGQASSSPFFEACPLTTRIPHLAVVYSVRNALIGSSAAARRAGISAAAIATIASTSAAEV